VRTGQPDRATASGNRNRPGGVPIRRADQLTGSKGTGPEVTTNYAWLPRTAENLAALDVVPPANFTHRAGPPAPATPPGGGAG
jgi:hypothetical protein